MQAEGDPKAPCPQGRRQAGDPERIVCADCTTSVDRVYALGAKQYLAIEVLGLSSDIAALLMVADLTAEQRIALIPRAVQFEPDRHQLVRLLAVAGPGATRCPTCLFNLADALSPSVFG